MSRIIRCQKPDRVRVTPDVVRRVRELAEYDLGKTVILSKDRAGFVVNALLVAFLVSAGCVVETGFATPPTMAPG